VKSSLTISARHRGPARSANGGYASGSLAAAVLGPAARPDAPVEVTLRRPPPLDTPMTVTVHDQRGVLELGEELVAEARVVDDEPASVDGVGAETAVQAMERFPGLTDHPFPGCFACGPDRAADDGLRIFPGPVGEDRGHVASLWVPGAGVDVPTTWAALDCVGGWSEDLEGRPCVLGRMTAQVASLPTVGETHVVVGRHLSTEGASRSRRARCTTPTVGPSPGLGTPGSRWTRPRSTSGEREVTPGVQASV
jgi:hypothetical protein